MAKKAEVRYGNVFPFLQGMCVLFFTRELLVDETGQNNAANRSNITLKNSIDEAAQLLLARSNFEQIFFGDDARLFWDL